MTSEVVMQKNTLFTKTQNGNDQSTTNNGRRFYENLYENANDKKSSSYENNNCHRSQQSSKTTQNIIYDVPKSNECIYAQPKSNAISSVDSLIPQAARLILAQTPKNRSDLIHNDRKESEDIFDNFLEDVEPRTPSPDYERESGDISNDFRDEFDYGLEVIHEETESQISSDSDQELDYLTEFCSDTIRQRKSYPHEHSKYFDIDNGNMTDSSLSSTLGNNTDDPNSLTDDIVVKHIRISNDWNPIPLLKRLHTVNEPSSRQNGISGHSKDEIQGHLKLLSGNRKKGTFWNAWKRVYCVASCGKLSCYSKSDCIDLLQVANLAGGQGQVDYLDPVEFVGVEQGKIMVNRILGVDDGKGHYFVFQCSSTAEAQEWIEALKQQTNASVTYAVPIIPKLPSMFRDILLIDLGSTNVRAGVLTLQATLPSLFFGAVMSEHEETGRLLFGDEVYLPENRKKAKIRFPFESTSKLCQNTININALKGFILKILKDINLKAENYRLILTLPRRIDNKSKTNILQLLFKELQFRSVLLCHQSVAAFWSYPVDNGLIVDIGERCDVVPVSQGFVLSHAWGRAPYGGHVLKHCLRQALGPQENGLYLSTPAENLVLRFISENFVCISAGNGGRKLSQDSQEIVVEMDLRDVLPFSSLIGVNQEILRGVAEGFFDPGYYGLDCESIQKIVFKSLQDCGVDIRKEMSQNILLVGGCTLIPGLVERLKSELVKLCPPHLKPKVQVSPYRYHASFIGASVLAGTDAYEQSQLQNVDYKDGPGHSHWLV